MLQNARFKAFTVSKSLRENEKEVKITPLPPTRLGLILKCLVKRKLKMVKHMLKILHQLLQDFNPAFHLSVNTKRYRVYHVEIFKLRHTFFN